MLFWHHPKLTSTCIDLQLSVDVGFVDQRVQHIKDTVDIPDLGIGTKEINFLFRLFGCFTAVLAERLELQEKAEIQ